MRQVFCAGLALLVGMSAGCNTSTELSPTDAEDSRHKMIMGEIGEMLKLYETDNKGKAPAKAANFSKYEAGFPTGYINVRDGIVVVYWGTKLADGVTDKIIAYEKETPNSGGYVLMQDGITVEKMTAEEFKAAPKAGEAKE